MLENRVRIHSLCLSKNGGRRQSGGNGDKMVEAVIGKWLVVNCIFPLKTGEREMVTIIEGASVNTCSSI